jgi:hypothetical protein
MTRGWVITDILAIGNKRSFAKNSRNVMIAPPSTVAMISDTKVSNDI